MSTHTSKELEAIRKEYDNRTDKPWGYAKVLISTDKYITKELFMREGYQTSFHYHEKKDETIFIVSGSGYVEFEEGQGFQVALEDVMVSIGVRKDCDFIDDINKALAKISTAERDAMMLAAVEKNS